ncbi:MAG: glycosyltransferase family 87 protein [Candidatus Limnocylindrales bacterium]
MHAAARPDRATLVALLLGALAVLFLLAVLPFFRTTSGYGYDLAAYTAAAARVAAGGTPYQPETLSGPFSAGPAGLYLYAPPLSIALAPFAGLPFATVAAGWWILRVALLALACLLLPVPPWIRGTLLFVAALSYPVLLDLNLGNVSIVVLLLTVCAWRWLDRPAGAIAVAVSLALRPTLAVLPIWSLLRRQWRSVAWTAGAGLVLIGLTLPFVGLGGYRDYLTVVRNLSDLTGVPRNVDLGSAALLLGLSPALAQLALFVGYGLGILAIALGLRRDRATGFVMTVMASLLLAPLLWVHYLVALILPAALLAARGYRWAILLPLLGWLPEPLLALAALAGTFLPLLPARRAALLGVADAASVADAGAPGSAVESSL